MKIGAFLPAALCLYMFFFSAGYLLAQTQDFTHVEGISQYDQLPIYLRDRGAGTPTSMFATFARRGELLVYPFFEYYFDDNAEYAPEEFGYGLDVDFRGRYRASEYLIFLGYGLTDRIAVELEAAYIDASLQKSREDTAGVPNRVEESGLGDVQTQVDFMWKKETESRPGFSSYFEVVYPHNKGKKLIGTSDWEFKGGVGIVRGSRWGTFQIRAAVEYVSREDKFEMGELAVEYIKRVSAHWRLYAGVEGAQDEWEFITEAQWHINDNVFFKFNNAIGITSKATDWAPEIGVMFAVH